MRKECLTKTLDLGVLSGANGGEQERFWKVVVKRIGTNIIIHGEYSLTLLRIRRVRKVHKNEKGGL